MKDFSNAGPRQCDLAPYSNNILSSLVIVNNEEPVVVESSIGREYEVTNDGFFPVREELPEFVWEDELTSELLTVCMVCDRSYLVEDLVSFDSDHRYCNHSRQCQPQ